MAGDAIGNNIAALQARSNLRKSNTKLQKTQGELSSGSQVNEPADRPAKAAVAAQIKSEIRGLTAASTNLAQGQSLLQFASGALSSTSDLLTSLYELTVRANTEVLEEKDREIIDAEFQSVMDQIEKNAQTSWGDIELLTGGIGTGSFITGPSAGSSATSGFVMGSLDSNSVDVDFNGVNYTVSLSIGGQPFYGTATPGVSAGASGSISLTSAIDSGTSLTIPNVGFLLGDNETTVEEAIRAAAGINSGTPTNYIPANPMTLAGATAAIPAIQPGSANEPRHHFLSYGTDGTDAIFKWQSNGSLTTTKIPIAEALAKFATGASPGASAFNGNLTLDDGTQITLTNFDLTSNTTFPGAIVYISTGTEKNFSIQSGNDPFQLSTLNFKSATVNGLGLTAENLLSTESTRSAQLAVTQAIDSVAQLIGDIGAFKSQIEYTEKNIFTLIENQTKALSEIADTDIPKALVDTQKYEALVDLSQTGIHSALKSTEKLTRLVQQVRGSG